MASERFNLKFNLLWKRTFYTSAIIISIPLVLSAFSHLWNPIGFPYVHGDEGHYMRRAIIVLEGGPVSLIYTYDHPYFGQLFLAGMLAIAGYPSSLHPTANGDAIHSIEMLHLVPRVLMGILAVADTFLIYKIAEVRYSNKRVAFIASVLFAVMPLSWLTRRMLLENLQLPFLLLSILFAVYYNKKNSLLTSTTNEGTNKNDDYKDKKKNIPLVILSGIFLGLAIFTKIPVFTMIPLVGFIIISSSSSATNKNNNQNNRIGRIVIRRIKIRSNLKALGIWFIPVILIPAIWPAYAISIGQFDSWSHRVNLQMHRQGVGIQALDPIFRIDPVLLSLGAAGIIFATVRRKDFVPLLWVIPLIIFFLYIHRVEHYNFSILLPIFCISAAILIEGLSKKISNNTKNIILSQKILPYAIISAIGIFGLISTIMLITTNVNSSYFQLYAFIVQHLPDNNNDKVTVIGTNWVISGLSWIPQYVLDKDQNFKTFYSSSLVKTKKVLLVVDKDIKNAISSNSTKKNIKQIQTLYITSKKIATFKDISVRHYSFDKYPYTSMKENRGIGRVEIRTNYE